MFNPMSKGRLQIPACLLAAAISFPAWADKPAWTSIAELLVGSIGEADPVRMSDVMTRCTALNMTLSGLVSDYSPEMSEHYQGEALRLIQNAVLIDSRMETEMTGVEADIPTVSSATVKKVETMLDGYGLWLDDNMASDGAYISKDIELEMDSCLLASKLVNQMLDE